MLFGLLTLITALSISAVAIYYSVAGLVAIFAAAALPIMIMGGVLEIGKLVTAVWLHRYWKQATWWLKTYLSTAVIILMLITSMGIFGFLSKAHIEQTAASTESVARAEVLQTEIDRNIGIVGRAENRIRELENSETGADANIQAQIDREQERIDSAYNRIQPAIDEQNKIIADVTALFQQELDRIDEELATLQGYIDSGEIRKAQGMVGTATDGAYGPKTAAAFTAWQDAKRAERNEWLQKIQQAANSPTVKAARDEIARLRKGAEDQIAQSNTLINRLRNQLGNTQDAQDIQLLIDEQNERIKVATAEIDTLTDEKIQVEADFRKLEAEVGPIKYIAEFIYGEQADTNMLEEAVRWVIIIIIFVFDPLAVLLLIASQYTFEFNRRKDDDGGWLRRYEQARAQRIVDNPGYNVDTPKEEESEDSNRETREEATQDAEALRTGQEEESVQREIADDSAVVAEEERKLDVAKSYITNNDAVGDTVSEADTSVADVPDNGVEQSEVQDNEVESEQDEVRRKHYEELDQDEQFKNAKQLWKDEHPDETIKFQKTLYIKGVIDELPWQDTKYIQNEEQNDPDRLWNKIKNRSTDE